MKPVLFGLVSLSLLVSATGRAGADYVFTTLESLNPLAVGAGPLGINNLGQIVGDDTKNAQGFLLSGAGYSSYTTIGPRARITEAWGINDSGQIVGNYVVGRTFYAYLYRGGSYIEIMGSGNGVPTSANGINNAGQIVGSYAGFQHGYLLSNGTYTTFDVPGAIGIYPFKINNSGQIVGVYGDANVISHGFLLSDGKVMSLDVPGAMGTAALGINDAGQIVGNYTAEARNRSHGFLLSGGSYTTLDVPGSISTILVDINDAGQIVGSYLDAAGMGHGFLATPTPEPATLVLLILGIACWIGFALGRNLGCPATPALFRLPMAMLADRCIPRVLEGRAPTRVGKERIHRGLLHRDAVWQALR
jgi:probable HAF family extracellular repeat protein